MSGADSVIDKSYGITKALSAANDRLNEWRPPPDEFAERARAAFAEKHHAMIVARGEMMVEMKFDLGGDRYREELQRYVQKQAADPDPASGSDS